MGKPARPPPSTAPRQPPLDGERRAEREAFLGALAPLFNELLQAARREVRYRLAMGAFDPDDPTPQELLDAALERAWRHRRGRPPDLDAKAWLLAHLFRTAEAIARREEARRQATTELLEEEAVPDPHFEEDDEDFWEWYEPEYPKNWSVFVEPPPEPPGQAAKDDELAGRLEPNEREVLLMHEVHGLPLRDVAVALGLAQAKAARLLESARHRIRGAGTDRRG
jgi:DNA-directed RNA polymerase specialized sigma24 family protein